MLHAEKEYGSWKLTGRIECVCVEWNPHRRCQEYLPIAEYKGRLVHTYESPYNGALGYREYLDVIWLPYYKKKEDLKYVLPYLENVLQCDDEDLKMLQKYNYF